MIHTDEDDEFDRIAHESTIKYRDAFPREPYILPVTRNDVLEEVAKEFDKMRAFGDTAASFAIYVRNMKDNAKT